ncbi:MAG TPA: hypothetical protein VHO84_15515 [Syntrophorhabdaceae bacterium]|nr:hypothetical protein [Syntrophorhabdaceae bacterium]
MKTILTALTLLFFFFGSIGCDRIETAIGLYNKVKEDAKTKSERARDDAAKIVKKKLPATPGTADEENESKEDED